MSRFEDRFVSSVYRVYERCAEDAQFTPYAVSSHTHDVLCRTFSCRPPIWVTTRIILAVQRLRTQVGDRKPTLADAEQALYES